MNGTTTVPKVSPIFSVRLPPMRMETPLSSPGLSALVMTLMQCMQRTQLRLSTASVSSSLSDSALVGQRATTLSMTYLRLFDFMTALTSFWSTFMSSRQVPMTEKSARWIEFMQSFGQPETLNLNLYGRAGRCMSSIKSFTSMRWIFCSLAQDCSQRAAPTHDIAVRTHGPAPPRSKPYSLISSKKCWVFSEVVPMNMMLPVWPWNAIRPEPYFFQESDTWRSILVV